MKSLTMIAIDAVTALILLAGLTPIEAACGGNPLIVTRIGPGTDASFIWSVGQWDGSNDYPGYYPRYPPFSYSVTPISPMAEATFWALGAGDPVLGPGHDAGEWTFPAYSWIYYNQTYYGYGHYAAELFAGWGAHSIIDGCIQDDPPGTCTCVLITDEDGAEGYFAIASNASDSITWFTELVQPGTDPAGNFNPIVLRQIPKPIITNSSRNVPQAGVDLTITVPVQLGPAGGIYQSGGSCACGPTGFQIVHQVLGPGAPPPSSRQASAWTPMTLVGGGTQGFTPMGDSVMVESICGVGDLDTYIATQLQFESGFVSPIVSENGSRISCGTTFAEPGGPRFRPGDQRPMRERRRSR